MHDNYIISYNVNIRDKVLSIQTYNNIKKREENIYFYEVLTHSFKAILEYNQILDIDDFEINRFISDNQIEISEMKKYCWPIDYQNIGELESFLTTNKYRYIRINASYGMFGWVLAKSYKINRFGVSQ